MILEFFERLKHYLEFKGLLEILKSREGRKLCLRGGRYLGYYRFELYSKEIEGGRTLIHFFIRNSALVIQQVYLHIKHKGTGTEVIKWLTEYARAKNLDRIAAIAITAPEMHHICDKLEFDKAGRDGNRRSLSLK